MPNNWSLPSRKQVESQTDDSSPVAPPNRPATVNSRTPERAPVKQVPVKVEPVTPPSAKGPPNRAVQRPSERPRSLRREPQPAKVIPVDRLPPGSFPSFVQPPPLAYAPPMQVPGQLLMPPESYQPIPVLCVPTYLGDAPSPLARRSPMEADMLSGTMRSLGAPVTTYGCPPTPQMLRPVPTTYGVPRGVDVRAQTLASCGPVGGMPSQGLEPQFCWPNDNLFNTVLVSEAFPGGSPMLRGREPPPGYAPPSWVPNHASYVPPGRIGDANWMLRAGGPSWVPLPVAGLVPVQALQTAPVLLNTQGHLQGHGSYVPPPSRTAMARSPPPQGGAQNKRLNHSPRRTQNNN